VGREDLGLAKPPGGVAAMTTFKDYIEQGWALTPLRPGTKKPIRKKWAERENAITTLADLNGVKA
jgi:hypothetical protein|tara:strand:- start:353 stop:547 length:195 start_codon:yes stop_codon:yes gene_type:complete